MFDVLRSQLIVIESLDEDILSIDKHGYYDSENISQGIDFYNALIPYLVDRLCHHSKTLKMKTIQGVEVSRLDLQKTLSLYYEIRTKQVPLQNAQKDIIQDLREHKLVLHSLKFAPRDDRDPWDYLPLLNLFKSIQFRNCEFRDHYLELPNTAVFFDNCKFLEDLTVYDYPAFEKSESLPIFRSCHFYGEVNIHNTDDKPFKRNVFADCNFDGELAIEFAAFSGQLFLSPIKRNRSISEITVNKCSFKEAFLLNYLKINSVNLSDNIFEGKFECKYSEIVNFSQNNCNFKKVSDFFESEFECFSMEKSVFDKFAAFEDTTFGIQEKPHDIPAIFKYVTFNSFSNFRGATFYDGLDIEKTNFNQPPNFLGATVPLRNTPRETFRIIKHSFDIVGNYLEANRFFALEMEKNKDDLIKNSKKSHSSSKEEGKKTKSDLIIFRFNQFFSNFGQSWLRPAVLILLLAVISQFIYCGFSDIGTDTGYVASWFCEISVTTKDFICSQSAIWLIIFLIVPLFYPYETYKYVFLLAAPTIFAFCMEYPETTISGVFTPILDILNYLVKQIPPFNKLLVIGHEFVSFVINILFAVLIWQLVVAVKRLTRR